MAAEKDKDTAGGSSAYKDEYGIAVCGLGHLDVCIDDFFVELDPKKWRPTPPEVIVKEVKLTRLRDQFVFAEQQIISASASHKDSKKVVKHHQKELKALEEKLDKCALAILNVRERMETASSKHDKSKSQENSKAHAFKLEKIKLPVFDGDFSEWQGFHDLFHSAVHNNASLSGAEKMVYLKTALKGEAKSIVHSFPSTSDSYTEAWGLVEQRFSNKREIVFSHLRKFHNLKQQSDSATGLRKVCDSVNECIRSLTNLEIDVITWDVIFVFWCLNKLDDETKKQWLLTQDSELPTIHELLEFLEKRATALVESKSNSKAQSRSSTSSHHTTAEGNSKYSCPKCDDEHRLYFCPNFKALSIQAKEKLVKQKKLCKNCLIPGHEDKDCKKPFTCRTCGERHSTLLHKDRNAAANPQGYNRAQTRRRAASGDNVAPTVPTPTESGASPSEPSVSGMHASCSFTQTSVVLMATILVEVLDSYGDRHQCRVFLDPGSEANFVTENFVDRLQIPRLNSCVTVTGIGGSSGEPARGISNFRIRSKFGQFSLPVRALLMKKLTGQLPRMKCQESFPHLQGLQLSDPLFYSPAPVDILLGAEAVSQIILPGLRRGPPGTPIAQNSTFDWFLTGGAPMADPVPTTYSVTVCHSTCTADDRCLDSALQKFWELEDPSPPASELTSEDQLCEEHFLKTHTRDSDGRFIVQLPFSPVYSDLGESRQKSIHCFKSLEKQFLKDPKMKDAYYSQMQDQIDQKWLEPVAESELWSQSQIAISSAGGEKKSHPAFYMPHHVVVKPESSTTKYRIVFNASAKTSSGNSLNSILLSGPKIQTDLHPLLIRFRTHPIALSADIVKFFHQIKITPEHTNFQRLVWRKAPEEPFMDLRFTRVSFGVTTAPYLATRCLRQLGEEQKDNFPLAHHCIQNDFLVDNLLSGAETIEEALEVKAQITEALGKGKFPLQKWASNNPDVISSIPECDRDKFSLDILEDESIKTIGLFWHPATDTFGVKVIPPPLSISTSKRQLLSFTARVFDPLQWLAPVTITPKILLQELWKAKIGWDEPIPSNLMKKWNKYHSELQILQIFRINRCIIFPTPSTQAAYELVGFCDASNSAFAACVYLKTKLESATKVELICAKSKVAPVHGETTPKLELCSAVLLAKLMNFTATSLLPTKINISSYKGFTDSTGALGQLFSSEKQPVFVLNRVRKIKNSKILINWHHVPGDQNPADSASRGISADCFLRNPLWLYGPPFLMTDDIPPQPYQQSIASFMIKLEPTEDSIFVNERLSQMILDNSSFPKMKRLVGYWIRFIHNLKKGSKRNFGPLNSTELDQALIPIVKCVQSHCFPAEIELCSNKKEVKSNIRFLSPFLDSNGILRVGGRLQNSGMGFTQRHPILLPKSHSDPSKKKPIEHFTMTVARHFHQTNLHAGPQLLLSLIRTEFWIPRGEALCSRIFRHCITCHKQNPVPSHQIMGGLPSPRVTPTLPFLKTGLDYAGPFEIAATPGRNPRLIKAYVCVFKCMAVKAIHLEFVSDLSTPAFIAAFQRFIAIRNSPSDIFCDCGSNFRGAKTDMDAIQSLIKSPQHQRKVAQFFAGEKVNYRFSPPTGPHHGGLWESAVKSMKFHLSRIVQGHHVSIEEFITLLSRTSAVMNSRPLTPLSTNPDDFEVLTPFHFLSLRPPRIIPEMDYSKTPKNRLTRWNLVQQMTQHLFQRWSHQYLQSLQTKHKWLTPQRNLQPNMMVLVHDADSSLGPQRWQLGRIEQTFPGKDGKIRVCDVRIPDLDPDETKKQYKILRRPITRLSPLPIDDQVTSNFITLSPN